MRVHHPKYESLQKHLVQTRFGDASELRGTGLQERLELLARDAAEADQIIAKGPPQLSLTGECHDDVIFSNQVRGYKRFAEGHARRSSVLARKHSGKGSKRPSQ